MANDSVENTAPEVHSILEGETRNVTVSFDGKLDFGDTLSGTPTVTISPDGSLTADQARVSDSAVWVDTAAGRILVSAGRAVLFRVTDALDDTEYTLIVECATTADPSQIVRGRCILIGASE